MHKVKFDEAVATICKADKRYKPDAYFFLRDTLDYTVKELRADELIEHRHVTGRELLNGLRDYAINELGIMAYPVLESWGVTCGRDIGEMVYNLIQVEAFGKSDDDHPTDFEGWMSFDEAFRNPYRPTRPVLVPSLEIADDPVEPLTRGNKPATTSEA